VREGRREHDARGERLRVLRLQHAGAAARDDEGRGGRARVGVRDAGRGAVRADEVVVALAPQDAGVDRQLRRERRLVAQVQLVQARGTERGAAGRTQAQRGVDLPVQADLPHVVGAVQAVVVEDARRSVERQRLEAGLALQQRELGLDQRLDHLVVALGDLGGALAPQVVAARLGARRVTEAVAEELYAYV